VRDAIASVFIAADLPHEAESARPK
jgi:hypothetical protein